MTTLRAALLTALLFASACNSSSDAPPPGFVTPAATPAPSPAPTPTPAPAATPTPAPAPAPVTSGSGGTGGVAGLQTRTVQVAGQARDVLIFAPSGYDPAQAWPLLVVCHGQGGSHQVTLLNWTQLAEREGLIVAATQATGSSGGWSFQSDVPILAAALTELGAAFNVDLKRRYIWGFSAGGHFATTIALANSDAFAAYGVVSGVNIQRVIATRLIPASITCGASDPNLAACRRDEQDLRAQGHPVSFHEPAQGHTVTPTDRQRAWDDMKGHALP